MAKSSLNVNGRQDGGGISLRGFPIVVYAILEFRIWEITETLATTELNSPLEQLSAAPVRYPFAVGPRAGRKTMTLRNPGARLHGCRS